MDISCASLWEKVIGMVTTRSPKHLCSRPGKRGWEARLSPGVEGYDASKWVVQDYGDVVVHVFDPDTREYYKLEELWADAQKIDWEQEMD